VSEKTRIPVLIGYGVEGDGTEVGHLVEREPGIFVGWLAHPDKPVDELVFHGGSRPLARYWVLRAYVGRLLKILDTSMKNPTALPMETAVATESLAEAAEELSTAAVEVELGIRHPEFGKDD
jgi:hypothetical protein